VREQGDRHRDERGEAAPEQQHEEEHVHGASLPEEPDGGNGPFGPNSTGDSPSSQKCHELRISW
jgi:hypothetical protein